MSVCVWCFHMCINVLSNYYSTADPQNDPALASGSGRIVHRPPISLEMYSYLIPDSAASHTREETGKGWYNY